MNLIKPSEVAEVPADPARMRGAVWFMRALHQSRDSPWHHSSLLTSLRQDLPQPLLVDDRLAHEAVEDRHVSERCASLLSISSTRRLASATGMPVRQFRDFG